MQIYLGPFIACRYKIKKVFQREYGCVNTDCSNYKNTNIKNLGYYCTICGNKLVYFEIQQKCKIRIPDAEDVFEHFDDDFYFYESIQEPNRFYVDYLTPRIQKLNNRKLYINSSNRALNATDCCIDHEIKTFKEKYIKQIMSLNKIYNGDQNIDIRWGAVPDL